jgi:TolA-binding protein
MTSERDDVQSVEKIGGAIIAFCVILLAGPLAAQETADPALELYYSANAAYNRKLYTIAITNYTDFLKRYSTHAKAQMARRGLGLSRFALKQYDLAAPEFDKLLSERNLDPKIDRAQVTLLHAQSLLHTNQKDEAQQRLIAAASSLPAGVYRTGATAAVTDLFFDQKDWPNTVTWARKLQEITTASNGQIIRAGYQEGFARYKLGQITEALVVLEKIKALAANERSEAWGARIRYLISECHVSKTTLDEAENSLQTALAGMTGTAAVNAQYRLAAIKFSREKWEDAKADYEAFLKETKTKEEEDPRIRQAKLRIGRCWMELGETGTADNSFKDLITVNDEFAARATLWRGRLYSRNKEQGDRYKAARPSSPTSISNTPMRGCSKTSPIGPMPTTI